MPTFFFLSFFDSVSVNSTTSDCDGIEKLWNDCFNKRAFKHFWMAYTQRRWVKQESSIKFHFVFSILIHIFFRFARFFFFIFFSFRFFSFSCVHSFQLFIEYVGSHQSCSRFREQRTIQIDRLNKMNLFLRWKLLKVGSKTCTKIKTKRKKKKMKHFAAFWSNRSARQNSMTYGWYKCQSLKNFFPVFFFFILVKFHFIYIVCVISNEKL